MPSRNRNNGRLRSIVAALFLGANAAVAVAVLKLAPRGFPLDHPRFWSNTVAPLLVLLVVGIAVGGFRRRHVPFLGFTILTGLWLGVGLGMCVLYPVSGRPPGLVVLLLGCLSLPMAWALRPKNLPRQAILVAAAIAVTLGVMLAATQRAAPPRTRPAGVAAPTFDANPRAAPTPFSMAQASFDPSSATFVVRCGGLRLEVDPLLTFEGRSIDRGWALFGPNPPHRELVALATTPEQVGARYTDDGESTVLARAQHDTLEIDAYSRIPNEIQSHLNSFATLRIVGHSRLSLRFSPAPEAIDVLPSDYPTGRPARSAWLDLRGVFHVAEASSGEKGPFRELAAGPLDRPSPLTLTLLDAGQPACDVTFHDWAAQADTTLSPTAGWGLPTNALEFRRMDDPDDAPAFVYLTLAGTSVGRGYDAVGHTAGLYQNRIRITPMRPWE